MEHYKNLSLEDIDGEVWLPIRGWEGYYEISNKGRVKSLSRKMYGPNSSNRRLIPTKIHAQDIGKSKSKAYARAKLNLNNKFIKISVHRLVAIHFIPNPENKPQVNHIDGKKLHNDVSNLEWATGSENQIHALKMGLKIVQVDHLLKCGDEHGRSILKEPDVISIRFRWDNGESVGKIKKDYPTLHPSTIRSVCIRKNWKHLP